VRVSEVDRDAGVDLQLGVLGVLLATVPGQGPAQLLGHRGHLLGERVAHRLGAVAGQRGPVVHSRFDAVAAHPGQVDQHGEPGGAFHEGADR
jgi:hypothetical protein